jgi:O-acetylhomoserine (thiol)-lyase
MSANRFDTLALHAGAAPDPATGARATPIYQTTSFTFRDSDHAAALFNMERAGHVYSRISNPTVAVFEERVAALENGAGAIGTASGQAALHLAIATLMGAGSHIVASSALYGGSHNLLNYTLRRFGIETTFVKPGDIDAWRAALRPNTKLLFGETLGNPGLDVLDIATVAQIAHEHRVPLLVDSTFTTPYLLKPFDHGADFVYHSATKFLGGHGTTMGGVIVDSGRFPWREHAQRFPMFNQPDKSYHGLVYVDRFGDSAYIARCRSVYQRTTGAVLSPLAAFLLLQGIETVALRVERHVENARRVAEFLRGDPRVEWINYVGFPESPYHGLAQKYLGGRACSLLTFGVRGGFAGGERCYDALRLIKRLVNMGDAKSLACHPASTTHRQMSPDEQRKAGVRPEMIRLSIGIEHIDDIIGDLDQALDAAKGSNMLAAE